MSADDQENVHLHANVPETVLLEETAHHDGLVEWCLATRSSSPNSAWIGELRTVCVYQSFSHVMCSSAHYFSLWVNNRLLWVSPAPAVT